MSDSWVKEDWELKTIGEIATDIYSGSEITKAQLKEQGFPSIRYSEIYDSNLFIRECKTFVNPKDIKSKRYVEYGDILIAKTSNKKENIGKSVAYLGNENPLIGNDIEVIKHNQNSKYLAYALSNDFCRRQIKKIANSSTVLHIYSKQIKQIKVPVPPRHIQDKIVYFLDKFLNLKNELIQELKERTKQYQYYLNLLIVGREEEGKRKGNLYQTQTIGEIAKNSYWGVGIPKSQLNTGDYPAIKCGDINSILPMCFSECISFVDINLIKNKIYFEFGDILISGLSNRLETIGKAIVYLNKSKVCLAGERVFVLKHEQNPKYLAYTLSTEFCRKQTIKFSQKSTVFYLNSEELEKIQIPLPPLDEQEKIVSILDKFNELCGDLSTGIPALIEEIDKQYQYYRDRIFSNQEGI